MSFNYDDCPSWLLWEFERRCAYDFGTVEFYLYEILNFEDSYANNQFMRTVDGHNINFKKTFSC